MFYVRACKNLLACYCSCCCNNKSFFPNSCSRRREANRFSVMNGKVLLAAVESLSKSQRRPTDCYLVRCSKLEDLPELDEGRRQVAVIGETIDSRLHWSLLIVEGNREGTWIDSLAREVPKTVERYLDGSTLSWCYSRKRLQQQKASTCGHWVVYCCHRLLNRHSVPLEKALDTFLSDIQTEVENDRLVVDWFYRHLVRQQD